MLKKELAIFLVVGGLTVAVDMVTYTGLVYLIEGNLWLAKSIGFIAGTIFAYFANKYWTFNHNSPGRRVIQFYTVYAITLGVNVFINQIIVSALNYTQFALQAGFFVATGASAAMNFIGMKYYVFKASSAGSV